MKPAQSSIAVLALAIATPLAGAVIDLAKLPPSAARAVDFAKDIRPIFEAACVKCHGPERQKGGLRLDRRADAFSGGDSYGPAIVAGKAVESPLLHSVSGLDEDLQMPQKGDPLTAEQVGLIRAWIDQGAVWPDDGSNTLVAKDPLPWSFLPLATPRVPQLPVDAARRARNDVDRFLLATLGEHQLTFSPEADARLLVRRLHLTLTGLPPSPEAVATFEADHRRDPDVAVGRLADRLLASPQFGERWAQHWLDVVRFAETNGSESNLYRVNAWPYRDYVIRAFNQDLPLDRFLREQIAGDALGVDEATGFLVAGMFVTPDTVGREEQAIRQARADRLEETIQGVSAAMLGVTMGCARCHNHKFDPIPQRDYYSLAAIFAGVEYSSRPWRTRPDAALHEARAAELAAQLDAVRAPLRAAGATWTEDWPTVLKTFFPPVRAKALRVSFPAEFGGAVDEVELFGPATGARNLALARGGAAARSHKQKQKEADQRLIDGVADRYHNWRARESSEPAKAAWFEIELPAEEVVDRLTISTDRDTLTTTAYLTEKITSGPRKFRVEAQDAGGEWREIARVDESPTGQAALPEERKRTLRELNRLATAYAAELPPSLFAGAFTPPPPTHLLGRGDPMNPRELVVPHALSALGGDLGLTAAASDRARRMAFAEWLTDPARNPLTPRVLANRLWLHVFGHGIVDTPGDFGKVGSPPSHPMLLDWLAQRLIEDGWSSRKLLRLMVTSAAFRQASTPNPAAAKLDAGARWLWRFPPRRAEAEVLRDGVLSVAGTLDLTMGGPGFRIHDDKKRYEGWRVVDNHGPGTWRRLIYQERMRGIDDMMFTAFDRPECGQVTPKRTSSTTPLQALNLLNGPFLLEQAEKLAERVRREAGEDSAAQVRRAFALALTRAPGAAEERAAEDLVRRHGLAALGRALFNSNEFIFIE